MRALFFLIAFFTLASPLRAQHFCGTETVRNDQYNNRDIQKYAKNNFLKNNADDTVAVTVHVVQSEDFPNAITGRQLLLELGYSNRYFEEAGIHFVNCGAPRTIQGKSSYLNTEIQALNRQYHVPNTINIYYIDQISTASGQGLCGFVSAFPWQDVPSESRFVVMAKDPYCQANGATIAHELGHFYGLLHTHETFMGLELVDGSNCTEAGDGFCDTPADPNLSGRLDPGCNYIGTDLDPQGQVYSPDVKNLMSYSDPLCTKYFSEEQFSSIRFYHETVNNYFQAICVFPDFTLASNTSLPSFRSDEKINIEYSFENIGLEKDNYRVPINIHLSEEEGELGQIIQRDTVQFSSDINSIIKNLDINFPLNRSTQTYFLTIVIDPNSNILEQDELNNSFTTEIEIDNSSIADELLYPNPTNGTMRFFFRDTRLKQDLDFYIFDIHGILVKTINGFKNRDEFFTELDVSELHSGLYFMEVFFEKQKTSRSFKFVKED